MAGRDYPRCNQHVPDVCRGPDPIALCGEKGSCGGAALGITERADQYAKSMQRAHQCVPFVFFVFIINNRKKKMPAFL